MKCDCADSKEYDEPDVEKRIRAGLKKVVSPDGWLVLYQCENCGSYWEKYYKYPEAQGGGPSSLHRVTPEYAKEKYGIRTQS
jgi:hypothetical protein